MRIVCLGGFLDAYPGMPSIKRDLAELNPLVIPAPRWGNNWRQGDWQKIPGEGLHQPFVVIGFSDGAPIALEVAANFANCVGVVFVSGLACDVPAARMWQDFPALCLYTRGELHSLATGTSSVFCALSDAGADATLRLADAPQRSWLTRRWPHMAGCGHHADTIRRWIERTF